MLEILYYQTKNEGLTRHAALLQFRALDKEIDSFETKALDKYIDGLTTKKEYKATELTSFFMRAKARILLTLI